MPSILSHVEDVVVGFTCDSETLSLQKALTTMDNRKTMPYSCLNNLAVTTVQRCHEAIPKIYRLIKLSRRHRYYTYFRRWSAVQLVYTLERTERGSGVFRGWTMSLERCRSIIFDGGQCRLDQPVFAGYTVIVEMC